MIKAVIVFLVGYCIGSIAYGSDFETRYKMRSYNDRIGTLCDGYLNGTYLIAIKGDKLFAIKNKEHGDWASYHESYDFDDIGFVYFKIGKPTFISITTGEKIRVKLSELEEILR